MFLFFFDHTATTEIYTLSLHDALPIWTDEFREPHGRGEIGARPAPDPIATLREELAHYHRAPHRGLPRFSGGAVGFVRDRKSTRLNSSHSSISYAVFCLKKKKK